MVIMQILKYIPIELNVLLWRYHLQKKNLDSHKPKITTPIRGMKVEIKYKTKWDSITSQYIVYNKRYNISGYGKTLKKAIEMFKFTVDDILTNNQSAGNQTAADQD